MEGFVNRYYQFCVWVMRFAYVNLLWVAFTIVGLGVFGFMPATVAMFSVVRKWNRGETEIPIFSAFWEAYRKEFLKANVFGLVLVLVGYILTIEFQILRSQESVAYMIASYGVIGIFILYAIVLLYFFPIFVHFNLKPIEYFKWSGVIGIVHPLLTIFLIGIVLVIFYLILPILPALIFFFGGSVTAYIIMWGALKAFTKYERASVV